MNSAGTLFTELHAASHKDQQLADELRYLRTDIYRYPMQTADKIPDSIRPVQHMMPLSWAAITMPMR